MTLTLGYENNINCDVEGVIPTITGIMGTLQANEVLNSILNFNTRFLFKLNGIHYFSFCKYQW